jgi:hypothetical protein
MGTGAEALRHSLPAMTNAIGIIRPFTTDDDAALTASALRFAERHFANGADGLNLGMEDRPWQALESELSSRPDEPWGKYSDTKQLRRLWQACLCRALRVPVSADITVAYGYVGYRAA